MKQRISPTCTRLQNSAFPAGGDVDRALPVLPKHVELCRETRRVHATYHDTCRGFHCQPAPLAQNGSEYIISNFKLVNDNLGHKPSIASIHVIVLLNFLTYYSTFRTINESTHTSNPTSYDCWHRCCFLQMSQSVTVSHLDLPCDQR